MPLALSRYDSTSQEVTGSARCAYPLCSLIDFLSFECDCCGQTFCLEHRTYRAHECKMSASKDTVAITCPLCQVTLNMRGTDDANEVGITISYIFFNFELIINKKVIGFIYYEKSFNDRCS